MTQRFTPLLITILLLAASHLLIGVSGAPLEMRTLAVLVITLVVPGYWLTRACLRESPLTVQGQLEWAVFVAGSGYVVQVLSMTLLSYLPGGITPLQTLLTFNGITFVLIGVVYFLPRLNNVHPEPSYPSPSDKPTHILGMVAILLVITGFFRLTDLGYSEFQGDEARAILKAAALLQGHEEALFLYRKGPTEIVVTAIGYSITGQLTESSARLPYTLAGILLPLTIFLIGWRMHSPLAGWVAGMFIALDGHFIGYARVAQYNTIDQFMSLLVLLVGIRLLHQPHRIGTSLSLISLYMAVGLLSHYEVAQTAIPLLFILVALWRQGMKAARIVQATLGAVGLGAITVLTFYIPFFLNPNITNTLDYLSENLIENTESHFPYNHLGEFFQTATFYSTTYLTVTWVVLIIFAIVWAYQRRWGVAGIVIALVLLGGLIGGTVQPDLFILGSYNLTVLWFVALMGGLWFTPMTVWMRLAWLWFIVLWGVSAFVTSFPSLHYLPAFLPSALVIGLTITEANTRIRQQRYGKSIVAGVATVGMVGAVVVALFTYRTFVYTDVEFIQTWDWKPDYGWTLEHPPGSIVLYGLPHQSGWKAVGMLYSLGILNGTYDTNVQEALAEWYTRRPDRCERSHRYFILELRESPRFRADLMAQLATTHRLIGTILVKGEPRMAIYEAGVEGDEPPWEYETTDFIAQFDKSTASTSVRLDTPAILPQPEVLLNLQMGDNFIVEGYTVEQPARQIGNFVHLTVYWRTLQKTGADFTAFTHLISTEDNQLYGQVDRRPGCTLRPTYQWNDGRQVVDHYEIPIADNAPTGSYVVRFGLYDSVTFQRLPLQTAQQEPLGDAVETEILTLE